MLKEPGFGLLSNASPCIMRCLLEYMHAYHAYRESDQFELPREDIRLLLEGRIRVIFRGCG
jgi:hypothetical protein